MNKSILNKYTLIWVLTGLVILGLIWQMYGDARTIRYTGIIRGSTQCVVKQELHGVVDDDLITYIDGIILNLQTGQGEHDLIKFQDTQYHAQLDALSATWAEMKQSIYAHRLDASSTEQLYNLSKQHYAQADDLSARAEAQASQKLLRFICFYFASAIICMIALLLWGRYNRKSICEIVSRDPLTGALTAHAFSEEATRIILRNKGQKYVFVDFDIRKFQKINIIYSYSTGNALLCNIVDCLTEHAVLYARITSDEFFVLMPWQENVADQLNQVLYQTIFRGSQCSTIVQADIKFRYGISAVIDGVDAVRIAMEQAHNAHKLARQDNKDAIYCDAQLLARLDRESYCEENLSSGIANKEFQLYLQPQVNLATNQVISAESLVRWKLKTGQLLFPDDFIPLFEHKGLIKILDYYMLEEVCLYLSEQLSLGNELYNISVNFSRVTLGEHDFYQKIMDITNKYAIPYRYIGIEVVETTLNNLDMQTIKLLGMLKEKGFQVAMDDFGAGYSSLSILSNLPVHVIKLDRQFLWSIDKNDKMRHIMSSIVNMAHNIGLEVLCEGVETQHHADFLRTIGCDYAQGYLYSRPVPKADYKPTLSWH